MLGNNVVNNAIGTGTTENVPAEKEVEVYVEVYVIDRLLDMAACTDDLQYAHLAAVQVDNLAARLYREKHRIEIVTIPAILFWYGLAIAGTSLVLAGAARLVLWMLPFITGS